jgi:hypothetical protein
VLFALQFVLLTAVAGLAPAAATAGHPLLELRGRDQRGLSSRGLPEGLLATWQ